MYTDPIHNAVVFLYVHYPVIATIFIAVIALNAIRKTLVRRRRRNVQARAIARKAVAFNTFEIL